MLAISSVSEILMMIITVKDKPFEDQMDKSGIYKDRILFGKVKSPMQVKLMSEVKS